MRLIGCVRYQALLVTGKGLIEISYAKDCVGKVFLANGGVVALSHFTKFKINIPQLHVCKSNTLRNLLTKREFQSYKYKYNMQFNT